MSNPALSPDLLARIERLLTLLRPTRLTPEAVAWGAGPDPQAYWIPAEMVPLWDTPEYAALDDGQRRRYNQYYALQMAEQFVWTERQLIVRPLERLLRGSIPSPSLRRLLESFVADEHAHVASIRRLLAAARPDLYQRRDFHLFLPPAGFRLVTGSMITLPRLLSSWALFICVLEEFTIAMAQLYRKAGGEVDPLFARVYLLHAQDEARHCRIDSLLCEWLIGEQGPMRRRLNAWMLGKAFRSYLDPGWGLDKPLQYLVADFPALRDRQAALLAGTAAARRPAFALRLIDGATAPVSSENAERFPMLANAIGDLARAPGPGGRQGGG